MLELKNISVSFKDFSLTDFSIDVEKGDYFVILGESGAGKSVILEAIAGLVTPSAGSIRINEKDITKETIQKRPVGLVFQDYAIFPHMTVYENIIYPLKRKKLSKSIIKEKAETLAAEMGISHLLHRNTTTLSGGEQQRVALARTLALDPEFLLLDEPLSSLDIKLREDLRSLLRTLNKKGQTIIHVTHEYEEAIALANKIAVVNNGKLIQKGTPDDVFHNPKSEFVANFTGVKNFFKTKITDINKAIIKNNIELIIAYDKVGAEGFALIRSEDIFVSEQRPETSAANNFKGVIIDTIPTKSGYELIVDVGVNLSVVITRKSYELLSLNQGKEI